MKRHLSWLAGALLAPVPSSQTTVRLNGEPARLPGGGVGSYQLSADGDLCVYRADQEQYLRAGLHAVRSDGSTPPLHLTSALPPESVLFREFALCADGSRVAFLVDRFDTGVELTLYAVPTATNEPVIGLATELVTDFAAGFPLRITRDGSHVVYRENVLELRLSSVPSDGSAAPTVLFTGAPVTFFELTPDESHVVFFAAGGTPGLWQVPLDGSAAAIPLHLLPEGHEVSAVRFANLEQSVLYLAGPAAGPRELWSMAFDGTGLPQRLNGPLASGGSVDEFALTPDGKSVVFRADQDTDEVHELYLTQAWNPFTLAKLVALPPEADVTGFALLPDGRGLAFLADLASDEVFEAWLAPLAPGATPRRLNEPLVAGGDVLELAVTDDARHVVYRADARSDERPELFAVPLGKARRLDPRAVRLNPPLAPGSSVSHFVLDAAARRVVFTLDPDGPLGPLDPRLLSAPHDGGESVDLGVPRPASFLPRPTGTGRLLAQGRLQPAFGGFRLFSVPSDGALAPRDLTGPMAPGPFVGEVHADVAVSPDGAQVFYRADQGDYDGAELFRVPSDGSAPATALSAPPAIHGSVTGFRLSPDGARAAYVQTGGKLSIVPTDASEAPRLLHERAPGLVGEQLSFTPDGAHLLHRAGPDAARMELYRVPADGSAAPQVLSGALVAGGTVLPDFALTAAGTRVVYRADESEDERLELWSAPVDGSAARLRLHAPLAATRDVLEFRTAPQGERVVFRADLDGDEVVELYSVLATDSNPVRLNAALVAGGDVLHFLISPDGRTVAYVADQAVDNRFELFRVPSDGSAAPVRLNGTLPAAGDILGVHGTVELAFNADGTYLVFVADALVNDRFELFSVLAAGGTPPVRLSPSLGATGDVRGALASWPSLALTADGTRVVFLAQPSDAARHVYLAPIDGATPATLLATPAPGASFERLLLDDDDAHVYAVSRDFQGSRLRLVPLDGSFAPLDLSPAPTATLEPYLVPGADRVLQRRDPIGPEELFSTGP